MVIHRIKDKPLEVDTFYKKGMKLYPGKDVIEQGGKRKVFLTLENHNHYYGMKPNGIFGYDAYGGKVLIEFVK